MLSPFKLDRQMRKYPGQPICPKCGAPASSVYVHRRGGGFLELKCRQPGCGIFKVISPWPQDRDERDYKGYIRNRKKENRGRSNLQAGRNG